ncbi:hypothetical protein L0666_01825 [Octadecabacter sp. CECT 8868]|uniref:hypothetical protein n=1 Tax=Octadecabacter algicola TaxID=2909342 RepID=UPI001F3C8EED|nr:hypothetical protein [Octadecabacter algicola]MCF2903714.1 hypothetical protein [Octadecabacter algicola]
MRQQKPNEIIQQDYDLGFRDLVGQTNGKGVLRTWIFRDRLGAFTPKPWFLLPASIVQARFLSSGTLSLDLPFDTLFEAERNAVALLHEILEGGEPAAFDYEGKDEANFSIVADLIVFSIGARDKHLRSDLVSRLGHLSNLPACPISAGAQVVAKFKGAHPQSPLVDI